MHNIHTHAAESRQVVQGRFTDFSEFSALIRGWTLDFQQLDRGPSPGMVVQVLDKGTSIANCVLSRQYAQRGETPAGRLTFAILGESVRGVRWCGSEASDASVITFKPGGEFEAVSRPGFACLTLSLSEALVEETAELLGLRGLSHVVRPVGVRQLDTRVVQNLRDAIQSVCARLAKAPHALETRQISEALHFEIPRLLLCALASPPTAATAPSSTFRQMALRRARPLLEQVADEALTIREVCRETGVSWRTLDYAFREHFGVTPKAYLQAIRLNRVREDLMAADSPKTVAQAANRWGFWHMGQFAADYRRQFGELPSQTLR